jgi:hypothetical protein
LRGIEFQPDLEKIAMYERKVIARRYAGLLRSMVGGQSETGAPGLNNGVSGMEQ